MRVLIDHTVQLPEPGDSETPYLPNDMVDLREDYAEKSLQVIVKLANIELTPEKPDYEGGSWHIEGQLVGAVPCSLSNLFTS
ncbi:hypothetical protein N7519_005517 [Penicillium mononematosum]|uniref:uncharacterized protein n=1 Tax=Penicillium mononematosum TaxID=268346 RepID=UPI00254872A8|nr:uncharacterized protein N7519_005517 [Penicillium mononematosum]KAJ6184216.1 hypothetical protein N7519_005517 [Penicillium mononematosum]